MFIKKLEMENKNKFPLIKLKNSVVGFLLSVIYNFIGAVFHYWQPFGEHNLATGHYFIEPARFLQVVFSSPSKDPFYLPIIYSIISTIILWPLMWWMIYLSRRILYELRDVYNGQ